MDRKLIERLERRTSVRIAVREARPSLGRVNRYEDRKKKDLEEPKMPEEQLEMIEEKSEEEELREPKEPEEQPGMIEKSEEPIEELEEPEEPNCNQEESEKPKINQTKEESDGPKKDLDKPDEEPEQ